MWLIVEEENGEVIALHAFGDDERPAAGAVLHALKANRERPSRKARLLKGRSVTEILRSLR